VVGDEEDVVPFWNSVARSPRVSPSAHGLDRVGLPHSPEPILAVGSGRKQAGLSPNSV
jgi:hypothetical protein